MAFKIMVVEDDPLIAQLLRYQLGGAGYEVVALANGLRALEHLPLVRPDLVLLDVMMPAISGWDVCRQIRACSNVPIIMLTAKGADSDVVAGLTAGADDYVSKPFSLPQLLARIEAVLRRARLRQPDSSTLAIGQSRQQYDPAAVATGRPLAATRSPARRAALGHQQPSVDPSAQPAGPGKQPSVRLGPQLYAARAARGATLHQAADACGVRWEFLQALEQEHFGYIPRPELRHTLRSYSDYLGLDIYALTGRSPAPQATMHPPSLLVSLAALMLLLTVVVIVSVVLL